MKILLEISTEDALTLKEAEAFTNESAARKLTPGELAVEFIRAGIRQALAERGEA